MTKAPSSTAQRQQQQPQTSAKEATQVIAFSVKNDAIMISVKPGHTHHLEQLVQSAHFQKVVSQAIQSLACTDCPLHALHGIDSRTLHALKKHGLETYHQIAMLGESDILRLRGVGRKSLRDLRVGLDHAGLPPLSL
jgi:predicted flap endonuclease-1-like 5' DNA nuclease